MVAKVLSPPPWRHLSHDGRKRHRPIVSEIHQRTVWANDAQNLCYDRPARGALRTPHCRHLPGLSRVVEWGELILVKFGWLPYTGDRMSPCWLPYPPGDGKWEGEGETRVIMQTADLYHTTFQEEIDILDLHQIQTISNYFIHCSHC